MNKTTSCINTLHTAPHEGQTNLSIYHSGTIDSQSITALLSEAENCPYLADSSMEIKRKILEIMTELLQNIYHHSARGQGLPTFLLENKENRFMLTATNTIYRNTTASLKKQISNLNLCKPEELKSLYRETLNNRKLINGHAGLGWIDICRKSRSPILFNFIPKDNKYSLFTVSVLI